IQSKKPVGQRRLYLDSADDRLEKDRYSCGHHSCAKSSDAYLPARTTTVHILPFPRGRYQPALISAIPVFSWFDAYADVVFHPNRHHLHEIINQYITNFITQIISMTRSSEKCRSVTPVKQVVRCCYQVRSFIR